MKDKRISQLHSKWVEQGKDGQTNINKDGPTPFAGDDDVILRYKLRFTQLYQMDTVARRGGCGAQLRTT